MQCLLYGLLKHGPRHVLSVSVFSLCILMGFVQYPFAQFDQMNVNVNTNVVTIKNGFFFDGRATIVLDSCHYLAMGALLLEPGIL